MYARARAREILKLFFKCALIFQNRFATSALFRIFAGNETINFRSATLSI